ncbi:hypothetical protein CIHG_07238 [Coccidioides immitis H538.4]|uniref:Ubiquitin-conjugating enzyme E2C-binding protein n=2 Tax=Coccidioides immitis TaxID=5501 RepID=A0A0J8RXA6_COCIT|nr:hypothetical protein CIRG_09143 [Coccidioides immitis RMSCC 2394]KMU89432.1 hypothetical protein CIHG_07238 [Coccidioides immitis H538.4]
MFVLMKMVSEQLLSRIFCTTDVFCVCIGSFDMVLLNYASSPRNRLLHKYNGDAICIKVAAIAVYVTLADLPNSSETQSILEIVPSRDELLLSVGDQKRSLRLPARVAPSAPSYFPLQPGSASNIDQREFSFRLQVDEGSQCFPSRDASTPQIPWSAKHMSAETQIKCRACGNILLEPQGGNRMVWKDLPSANWAELMDIWHCHKPDSHEDGDHKDKITHNGPMSTHNESAASKGYGAGNHTVCQADTVLVDVMNFYVTETNAVGVESMLNISSVV